MILKANLKDILNKYKYLHGINLNKLNKNEMETILKNLYIDHRNECKECTDKGHCEVGGDLFEPFRRIVNFFRGPRNSAPPIVRKFIKKYGDNMIIAMKVCRTPIFSVIDKILNLISLGQFHETKKKYYYDDLYHLFILATIKSKDGIHSSIKLEKNHVLNIELSSDIGETCIPIDVPANLSVKDFINNGHNFQSNGGLGNHKSKDFYLYDPIDNNCQSFITALIKGSHLDYPQLDEFILQNSTELLPGYAKKIARFITDIPGRLDRLIYGEAIKF